MGYWRACRSILARLRSVPPVPTRLSAAASRRTPDFASRLRTRSRSFRTCLAVGGSDVRNFSLTRSAPNGRLTASSRRRRANRVICRLPPPRSKSSPFDTSSPLAAPAKPYRASTSPSIISMRMPNSRRTRWANTAPFLASRIAAVATAAIRFAPDTACNGAKVAERLHCPRHRLFTELGALVYVVHEAEGRARAGEQPQVARRIALEHHDAPGVRADVDDGDRVAVGKTRAHRAESEGTGSRRRPQPVNVFPSKWR